MKNLMKMLVTGLMIRGAGLVNVFTYDKNCNLQQHYVASFVVIRNKGVFTLYSQDGELYDSEDISIKKNRETVVTIPQDGYFLMYRWTKDGYDIIPQSSCYKQ